MTKRYLKPKVQDALIGVELLLLMFIASIDDFTLEAIPFILSVVLLAGVIGFILAKHGRALTQ